MLKTDIDGKEYILKMKRFVIDNSLCPLLYHDQINYYKLAINVEHFIPADGCFLLKDYGENKKVAQKLLNDGILEKTGRTCQTGWITVPEVKIICNNMGKDD
jgi:hypothetical protein